MLDCKLLVNDINVIDDNLNIDIAILCTYDPNVIAPKVKIVFESGNEVRRLPFPVVSYFKRQGSDEAVTICNYIYKVGYIFSDISKAESFTARIEFSYGNNYVEELPFYVSRGLILKNSDFENRGGYLHRRRSVQRHNGLRQ